MSDQTKPVLAPRFVDAPARQIVGVTERYAKNEQSGIPDQWARVAQAQNALLAGRETFGVAYDFDDHAFSYLIGVEDSPDTDSTGLTRVSIPAGHCAVFDLGGTVADIPALWEAILGGWSDEAGYAFTGDPEYEIYEPNYNPQSPGGMSVWMPVRPKG